MSNYFSHMLRAVLVFALWTIASLAAAQGISEENNICRKTGIVFAFMNGVQNTTLDAMVSKEELRRIHGDSTEQNEEIRYEVLYNYSNGFEDFVETFEQRLQEQEGLLEGRFELFFEALHGDGPWWSRIVGRVASTAGILDGFVDWYKAKVAAQLASLFANPPTQVNYAEHRTRIDNWVLEGKKILFVAHSQGNLFANAAYAHAQSKASTPESVKVVHIAPASPTLSGAHTLADLDLVINGLRAVGTVASITDNIPGYLLRPAGVNGRKDALGHGLIEIYINPALAISTSVKHQINTALGSLATPVARASSGIFTVTLTWDGTGDVDLHTFEPNGSWVYYASKQGTSGYLDYDNTVAQGPEHYYASCDKTKLSTGTYQIKLANYARAEGRVATVQVASQNDGVLGTRTATMGAETGENATFSMFNVIVSNNPTTGKYSVSLGE